MSSTSRLVAIICLLALGALPMVGCGSVNTGRTQKRVAPINRTDTRMMEAQLRDRRGL